MLPISRDSLDNYADQINHAIESAALFLKQVAMLEVRRKGKSIRKIETTREENTFLIADGSHDVIWRIFQGNFESKAMKCAEDMGELLRANAKRCENCDPRLPDN